MEFASGSPIQISKARRSSMSRNITIGCLDWESRITPDTFISTMALLLFCVAGCVQPDYTVIISGVPG
ncbi:hypothetical protein D3C72_920650 [compost metagenome]